MVVLDVGLEMLGKAVDALREDRHLYLWRSGIAGLYRVALDHFGLAVGGRAGMSSSAVTTTICAGQRPRKPGNIAKPVPAPVEIVTARRWREQSAAVDRASFTLLLSSYAAAD